MSETAGGDSVGALPSTRYTREELGELKFEEYRKIAVTDMAPVEGPFIVSTKEGAIQVPKGWKGYIALDTDGDPYPVELSVAEATYRKV